MTDEVKKQVISDLEAARDFVSQAQNRLGATKAVAIENNDAVLWTELGELFDQIDDAIDGVN